MPRGPRVVYENAVLSITSRGNNKRRIFRKKKDYLYFKKLLLKYAFVFSIQIYHYCLMKNHFHLVTKIRSPESLAKAMKALQLAYLYYYKKDRPYVGRFWQGRFYSKIIKDDKYLLTSGLYIEDNPVRAGAVKKSEHYPWSSYRAYAFGNEDPLVTQNPYFLGLGENNQVREERYRELMEEYSKNRKVKS